MGFSGTNSYQSVVLHAYLFEGHWNKKDGWLLFHSEHNNNFQSQSMVTMQTICSILATHLIYKLAGYMLSLWQTGFLLTSWLPSGGMTFPPHFEQQSHSIYIITAWIEYSPLKKHFVFPNSLSHILVCPIFIICLFCTWVCPCLFNTGAKTFKETLKIIRMSARRNSRNFMKAVSGRFFKKRLNLPN